MRLRAKPNFRTLGKRYGKRTPAVAAAAARLDAGAAPRPGAGQSGHAGAGRRAGRPICPRTWRSSARWPATGWWQSDGPFVAALDPQLDEALRREGLAREVVNRIQRLRKEAGYVYTDRIALWIDGDAAVLEAVRAHASFIRGETLARRLELGARAPAPDLEQQVDIDGHGSGGGSATTIRTAGPHRPSTHGRVMNKKQLTHLEKRLLEERARVMKELGYYDESFNATLQSSDGDLSSYSFHMADQGTDAMEREKQFLFASQEGRYLWHVNEALRRLYGTPEKFGHCHQCGQEINFERLDALPHARLCITCKEKEEDGKRR